MLLVAALLPAIFLMSFVGFVLYVIYQHKRFAHFPGPPRSDFFTGHVRQIIAGIDRGSSLAEYLTDQMRAYGLVYHLFMFYKPVVVVLEPNFLKEVLHSTTHTKPPQEAKTFWNVFGQRFVHHGLLMETDVPKYLKRRALFTPAFHRHYLMNLMDSFNESADILIKKLAMRADGKTKVFMLEELNRVTLDVIAKVAFGLHLNITSDDNLPLTKAVKTSFIAINRCFLQPWIKYSFLPSHRQFRQEVRSAIRYLRETGRKCVQGRLDARNRGEQLPNDILTYILDASKNLEADADFKMEEMLDEFVTFFIAGQETTANLMAFMLHELGHHPEIMLRVVTEVNAVLGDRDYVEYGDLAKFEYMSQVIKETLRLWPPAFGTNRLMASDVTVKGMKIPAGTVVWLNTYAMGRIESHFKDPLVFNPDRFHKSESEDRPVYAYFPFSMGTRSCLGQQFALIEARLIMARLLHNFEFKLCPGQPRGDIVQHVSLQLRDRCMNYLTLANR
ncbi:cholesterol 24-hydroxylase-like [Acanthaster planci]|uniref:Cholesterol 24-hydroxylase-like n=1 Tax=Acanthaster planci TaxID=133434 RepID=A0A8B7YCR5_ACAPL|nr:cholesterol 24-hydroxylase-like [Acanthaster planci]